MEPNTEPIALYEKLLAIMSEAQYIQKDGEVAYGSTKFKYASEKVIKELIQPLLVKHGVLFFPTKVEILEQSKNSKTTTRVGKEATEVSEQGDNLTRIRYWYRFADVTTGQFIEGFCDALGHDNLDKGWNKAITGAIKYVLSSTFLFVTGNDPDNLTPAQKKILEEKERDAMSQLLPREDQYERYQNVLAAAEKQGKLTARDRINAFAKAKQMKLADDVEAVIEKVAAMLDENQNTQGE